MKPVSSVSHRDDDAVALKHDVSILKWMTMTALAFQVAIFVKLFIH